MPDLPHPDDPDAPTEQDVLEYMYNHRDDIVTVGELCDALDAHPTQLPVASLHVDNDLIEHPGGPDYDHGSADDTEFQLTDAGISAVESSENDAQ